MATPVLWKDVVGFEGLYIVNCHGEIRSTDHYVKCNTGKRLVKGRVLKSCDRGNGYPFVTMGKNGKQYNMSVHRVVAMAFLPNPKNLPEVNHKDTDTSNFDYKPTGQKIIFRGLDKATRTRITCLRLPV